MTVSASSLEWDYGPEGQPLRCWVVARSTDRGIAPVYCPTGFGPVHPWGAVSLNLPWMGRDGSWFASLDDAASRRPAQGPNADPPAVSTPSGRPYRGRLRGATMVLITSGRGVTARAPRPAPLQPSSNSHTRED